MIMELPIAWLQLRSQKLQTFWAIATITFITVLLFMQIGSRIAFLDAIFLMPQKLKGDLFMFNASTVTALRPDKFSQRRLFQVQAFNEVETVIPLYMQGTQIPKPTGEPGFLTRVLVIGTPINYNPFEIKEIEDKLPILGEENVLLIDKQSRPEFRSIIKETIENGDNKVSLRTGAGQVSASIRGTFSLGVNDANYSHLLTSDVSLMNIFGRKREDINVGVIHLKPGTDIDKTQKLLIEYLPSDVVVRQKHEMIAKEKNLFEFGTPLGMVFRFAMGTAIVVGIIVVYQILFQLTSKYIREYSTLKAIGYSHAMLIYIVLTQAITLTIPAFTLGIAISYYLYDWMSNRIGIPYEMKFSMAISVFALVTFISLISALIAIRKLREADPADLFG